MRQRCPWPGGSSDSRYVDSGLRALHGVYEARSLAGRSAPSGQERCGFNFMATSHVNAGDLVLGWEPDGYALYGLTPEEIKIVEGAAK